MITRNIPNTITSCNLFCGCIASYMAFHSKYELALLFIVLGATFDFFDGMTARLLHVSSPIGKELDSLADDITFGLAPAAIAFSLFKEVHYPDFLQPLAVKLANEHRSKGMDVALVCFARDKVLADYEEYGRKNQFGGIVYIQKSDSVLAIDLSTGEVQPVEL